MPVQIAAKIEGVEKTEADFKAVRTRINTVMRDTVVAFGEHELLPIIRTLLPTKLRDTGTGLAPGRMASSMYIQRDRTTVSIASRLTRQQNRALGWIDFGGVREYTTKAGTHVTQRRREGSHAILRAVDEKRPGLERRLLEAQIESFRREGFQVS